MHQTRTLSSPLSFFYKVVFPTVWLGGFGAGTLALFARAGSMRISSGQATPPDMKWHFLVMWLLGAVLIYWACIRLKKVSVSGPNLLVSNYLRTVTVPLASVQQVSGTRLLAPEHLRVSARLSPTTQYRFVFMPPLRFSLGLTEHPLAAELRAMVDVERAKAPDAA